MTERTPEEIAAGRCGTCRFGGAKWCFIAPDPLPEPIERRALFGLIRWQEGPTRWQQAIHDHQADQAENMVPCCRYPEERPVKKTHWCGEYQPLIEKDSRRGG